MHDLIDEAYAPPPPQMAQRPMLPPGNALPVVATRSAITSATFNALLTIQELSNRRKILIELKEQNVLVENVDYGVVPGTDKPALLKAGAERLNTLFGFSPRINIIDRVEDWTGEDHGGEALFRYIYRVSLYRGDVLIAECDGECNSRETKYRWRWVRETELSDEQQAQRARLKRRGGGVVEFDFAIRERLTTGKYGKPETYWDEWDAAIESGKARQIRKTSRNGREMDAWTMDATFYRVANDDVASVVNTIIKMAQKRALVGATLLATNASEFFTQDVEDLLEPETSPPAPGANAAVRPQPPQGGARPRGDDEPQKPQKEYRRLGNGDPDLEHDETFLAEFERVVRAGKPYSVDRAMVWLQNRHPDLSQVNVFHRDGIIGKLRAGEYDAEIDPGCAKATPQQVQQVKELLNLVRLPEGTLEKWFNKAQASRWEDMPVKAVTGCITYLKQRLPNGEGGDNGTRAGMTADGSSATAPVKEPARDNSGKQDAVAPSGTETRGAAPPASSAPDLSTAAKTKTACRAAANAHGIEDDAVFEKAWDLWVVAGGWKGKEGKIPNGARAEVFNAMDQDRFDYAQGKILPVPVT